MTNITQTPSESALPPAKSAGQKLREFLWPIYGREHFKFIPMTFMISLILFNYTLVRQMKDVLVTTAAEGSQITVFLKGWAVLPAALLFFMVYSKLSNIFSRQTLFYGVVTFFLAFFALFALVLYPNNELIHPIAQADRWIASAPTALVNFIVMYKFWSFSLFYTAAELWGAVVASLLFWQFANSIVHVSEAKRFYAHFYLLANIATAASGLISREYSSLGKAAGNYGLTVNYAMFTVVACGIVVMFFYFIMDKYVLAAPAATDAAAPKKKKLKLSLSESVKFILHNQYLLWITILVISYGISINLIEVQWKNQIRTLFPDKASQGEFWGHFYFWAGISTFFVILLGGSLIRWFGWRVSALATPIIIGLTGSILFYFILYGESANTVAAMIGTSALAFTVYFGAVQNILSKSTKYALFDPTKEMSYIPLDEESKVKGKAAVDVVGGRLGKAGGGYLQQGLFAIFLTPLAVAPYSAGLMLIIVLLWIIAVCKLYKLFVLAGGEND